MELLQEVDQQFFPAILEALQKDWPKHFIPYQMFKLLNEFKKANCQFYHTIYLFGEPETGIYLSKITLPIPGRQMHSLYVYTPSNDLAAMNRVLQESSRFPWLSEPFRFEMIHSSLRPLIEKALVERGIKFMTRPNIVFTFPHEALLALPDIPNDVYLKFLKEEDVEEVDRNWHARYLGSDIINRECITKNFGLGLFTKCDDKMVSSSVSNYSGGIFTLYTDPQYRGRGYAPIVIMHMVKKIREQERIPFSTVNSGNAASLKIFRKLGFKQFDTVDFFRIIS